MLTSDEFIGVRVRAVRNASGVRVGQGLTGFIYEASPHLSLTPEGTLTTGLRLEHDGYVPGAGITNDNYRWWFHASALVMDEDFWS